MRVIASHNGTAATAHAFERMAAGVDVLDAVVDGVSLIEDDPTGAYIDFMAQKYLGSETYPWGKPGDERVTIVIEPTSTTKMG